MRGTERGLREIAQYGEEGAGVIGGRKESRFINVGLPQNRTVVKAMPSSCDLVLGAARMERAARPRAALELFVNVGCPEAENDSYCLS